MSDHTLYAVFTSQDGSTARLGWTSQATGITYCGICLGSAIEPREGELCPHCGACVVGVFSPHAGVAEMRRAWSKAHAASAAQLLSGIAS